jgi:ABC-type lipoprotein export system ATPase subunit
VAEPLVELKTVSRQYGESGGAMFAALEGIDLTMASGEIRCVVGPSGSGKTTLLQILGLLDSPTSGTYRFLGHDTATLNGSERTRLRAQGISFMFQENWLIPWLSSLENVLAPQVHIGPVISDHRLQAMELLERLGLGDHAHKRVTRLSGGQRQRVCMARALLKKPRLVIADEPSASLDSHTAAEILDLFLDIREREGCGILIATHDPALMEPLGSSLIHLRDGRIIS